MVKLIVIMGNEVRDQLTKMEEEAECAGVEVEEEVEAPSTTHLPFTRRAA